MDLDTHPRVCSIVGNMPGGTFIFYNNAFYIILNVSDTGFFKEDETWLCSVTKGSLRSVPNACLAEKIVGKFKEIR